MMATEQSVHVGVLGWPITHSCSPLLHRFWLKQYRIDGDYVALAVAPEDFFQTFAELPERGFSGVNITVPHKQTALEAIIAMGGTASGTTRRIGAVNTVIFHSDGTIEGRNTDVIGFVENLKEQAPQWSPEGPAVVLGAGGAVRAVCAGLLEEGVKEIRLVNRTEEKIQELMQIFNSSIVPVSWKNRETALAEATLLVNGTSLGMAGHLPLELSLERLPATTIVYDIVYAPLETPLLRAAQTRGNPVVDGLGMLIHQARPAFEAWFGISPEISEELRKVLEADLREGEVT
jgi:shikimate dehydrogenase